MAHSARRSQGFAHSSLFTCVILGSASLPLFAEEMQIPIDVEVVNQRVEVTGYLDDEREEYWALEGNELLDILTQSIDATRLETLRSALQNEKVTRATLQDLGWDSEYRADELIISISVPVSDRKLVDIPLQNLGTKTPPTGIPHIEPVLFSGVLNTYWSHSHNLVNTDYSASQVALRGITAIGPITFEDGHTYTYNHFTDKGTWVRDRTRVISNLPNHAGYLQFGDYQIETDISSLPSGDLFGLSYSYQPQYLEELTNPNSVPISLESTSLVKININGEEYRTLRLAAGQYNLKDLPLEQGVNEVEVSYIDQGGIEQKRFFNLVDHPQLLLKGDIETQLLYGARQRYENNGTKSIDRDIMSAQGVISYGLTEWWTLSSVILYEDDEQNFALNQNFALGDLFFSLDSEFNQFPDSHSYQFLGQVFIDQLFDESLSNVSFRYGVNQTTKPDPLVHKLSFSSSIDTPFDNGYLSVNLDHEFDNERTQSQGASLNASYRFSERISTSVNLRWQKNEDQIDRSIYLSFSMPLRWNNVSVSARTSFDSRNDEYQTEVAASQYQPDYYWRAATKFVGQEYDGLDSYGKWYGNRVTLNARYSSTNESRPTKSRILSVGADTAIAWAGSNVILTSPVTSSFNIVSLPEEYQDRYQLSYDQYKRIQITDAADNAGYSELLVPISNDGYRTIRVDGRNLAFNEELKQGEFVALSGLYSGSSHQLTIDKGYFVSGQFYNQKQKPMADIVGEFQSKSTNQTYPFFTDEEGNFELDVLPEGDYRVRFYDNAASARDIQISATQDDEQLFIDLGNVIVISR
ncbi:fimbria/pilus outer membrane usher protein [Vibrio renipiscarius]|uniref:fimbria/pilus outer membrane usher protein n=1 Tax=Vibrio renipiscarius TaxID=1461322 RepID=UPI00354FE948